MVIDDDPYGLLRFAGEPPPTLRELGGGDPLVFSVRTFSKIVAPGLRVGWVDTVPELQPLLINAKQAMDTCTNLPAQRLLTGFLTGGHLEKHLITQRAEYKRRKEAMHAALREHFGDIARWTNPEGGFFCWVTLANGVHATELFDRALAEGVAFIPGAAFSPSGGSPTPCVSASPPPRPTGSTKESPGCDGRSTCSRRADWMGVSAAEQAVLDRIDEASLVDLTTALVRAAGQNPPGGEAATVNVLHVAAVELGLDVVEIAVEPGRNNVRVTLDGGAGPGLLLLGYTHVVPVGESWTTDPFGVCWKTAASTAAAPPT